MDLERATFLRSRITEFLEKLSTEPSDEETDNLKVKEMLEELQKSELTKELLSKSKLGVEVNKLRKATTLTDAVVCDLATKVLFKWKDVMLERGPSKRVSEEDIKAPGLTETLEQTKEPELTKRPEQIKTLEQIKASEPLKEKRESTGPLGSTKVTEALSDLKSKFLVRDSVRDKCFEMLLGALMADSEDATPDELTLSTCRSIEECLWEEFGTTSASYKAKFRSKYLNLKDRGNITLRRGILSGAISPARFHTMTAAEMASEERRRADSVLIEQNLREAKAAQDTEAETDQFKCGRCHQRKTKYYQLQTRSADEPMTTFVTCINCGNRWKFC